MRDAIALAGLLDDGNVKAFLQVIRAGEGTADEGGYRRHFGGRLFDSFADHPRMAITAGLGANKYTSTAAGAYQFLARTWDGLVRQYGFANFEPKTQDIAALALIDGRKALDDVLAGRFELAVRKCNREWASLPESPYGQPVRTMAQARATYRQYGGLFVPAGSQPITPSPATALRIADVKTSAPRFQQETTMPLPALIMPLAAAVIELFTPLAKEKIQKEMARHSDNPAVIEQISTGVIDAVKVATGVADPIDAVAALKADPVLVQQVEDNTLDNLAKLAPVLDKIAEWDKDAWAAEESSRDQAAKRAASEEYDMTKILIYGAFAMFGVLLTILFAVIGVQLYKFGKVDTEVWAQFAGIIGAALGIVGTIYTYRFGSSRSSGAKDVVIGELSRRSK